MELAATLQLAAFAVAIEACLGYPQGLFHATGHPVTWTGRLIALADDKLNHDDRSFAPRRALGFAALFLLLSIAGGGAYLFSRGITGLELSQPATLALTALIASSLVAQRSLHAHVLAVAEALAAGLAAGRAAAAKIVGRDVAKLDEAGVGGQGNGRHRDLLPSPAVRIVGPKGGPEATPFVRRNRVDSALPADRRRPVRHPAT